MRNLLLHTLDLRNVVRQEILEGLQPFSSKCLDFLLHVIRTRIESSSMLMLAGSFHHFLLFFLSLGHIAKIFEPLVKDRTIIQASPGKWAQYQHISSAAQK